MKTRSALMILTIVFGLLLAGCVPLPSASGNALLNTNWVLTTLSGQAALADTQVTIRFEDGQLSGTDGCNRYSAPYTVNGAQLSIDKNMISTLMACAEPIMAQSTAYTAALIGTATYKTEAGQLTLFDAGGKPLAVFSEQSTGLAGSWTVTGYNNGQEAVVSVIAGSQLTAGFDADGRLSGSAGCNTFTATYEVSGQSITIGAIGSTRMACASPDGLMTQETQYLQALATATTYARDGNRLELRTADGALAVSLVLAD